MKAVKKVYHLVETMVVKWVVQRAVQKVYSKAVMRVA